MENGLRRTVEGREADLLDDERSVQARLGLYRILSQVAVILGIVAPILAGSTVLASLKHIPDWSMWTGILTLIASGGVALHKGLDCDRYHAKCLAALAELRALAAAYNRLLLGVQVESGDAFDVLEARLDRFYRDYGEVLPLRATRLNLHGA